METRKTPEEFMQHNLSEVFNLPLTSITFTIWKKPRIDTIRKTLLVERLAKFHRNLALVT